MTAEEAITELNRVYTMLECKYESYTVDTFETAVSALEKQIPKKPCGVFDDEIYGKAYVCECTGVIDKYQKFCPTCGQAIDWSAEE